MRRGWLLLLILSIGILSPTHFGQTDDWRHYSSTAAGYKVGHPSDWQATEEWIWPVGHVRFISPGIFDRDVIMNAGIGICSQPMGHVGTPSNTRSWCRERDDHLSDHAKNKVISDEIVEVNGLKIRKKVSENRYRPTVQYLDAFLSSGDRSLHISGTFPKRFDLDRYIPVFDQLLSTLQLLDKPAQITYSNSRLGFSLTYPSSWRSCPVNDHGMKGVILRLAPEERNCLGSNSITFRTAAAKATPTAGATAAEIAVLGGERFEGTYFYRDRYSRVPDLDDKLLQISEMYDRDGRFRVQGEAILATMTLR